MVSGSKVIVKDSTDNISLLFPHKLEFGLTNWKQIILNLNLLTVPIPEDTLKPSSMKETIVSSKDTSTILDKRLHGDVTLVGKNIIVCLLSMLPF